MLFQALRPFCIGFFSLFIAVDCLGHLTAFLSLTEQLSHIQKKKVIHESIFFSFFTLVLVAIGGMPFLRYLGVDSADYNITAGVALTVLSIHLLLTQHPMRALSAQKHIPDFGVVPLIVPLIAGPAPLLIALFVYSTFGLLPTIIAVVVNACITWLVFKNAEIIYKIVGERGRLALSNVITIALLALSIMIARQGIIATFIKV